MWFHIRVFPLKLYKSICWDVLRRGKRLYPYANTADTSQPGPVRTNYLIQYGESLAGDVEVIEYFTEVDVPVTDTFGVVGAIRRSEYTNTGGAGTGRAQGQSFDYCITTWKVKANWDATDWLTLGFVLKCRVVG